MDMSDALQWAALAALGLCQARQWLRRKPVSVEVSIDDAGRIKARRADIEAAAARAEDRVFRRLRKQKDFGG